MRTAPSDQPCHTPSLMRSVAERIGLHVDEPSNRLIARDMLAQEDQRWTDGRLTPPPGSTIGFGSFWWMHRKQFSQSQEHCITSNMSFHLCEQ